ncbi:MAG TPA: polyphenol oxidase family protein [Candidatus Methylacidiphilales bacterium]
MLSWETYPEWAARSPGLRHAFSLRSPVDDGDLHGLLPASVKALWPDASGLVEAEQPHGNGVAVVGLGEAGTTIPQVDALVTNAPGLVLAVRAADCGPVWFHDPKRNVAAVAHSGRKGTEKDIVGATLQAMERSFGCVPADVAVFLGPCIRPPDYEVDFAAEIGRQAVAAGAGSYLDSGRNTAANLASYYSYRAERGQTGRMWAVAMLNPGGQGR